MFIIYLSICSYVVAQQVERWTCNQHKIVSEMTYNVSSGTLNPSIPYQVVGSNPTRGKAA